MITNWNLVIFLKAPRAGLVKTRLAETIGADAAADAYRELVQGLLRALKGLANVQLRFAPQDARADVETWCRPGWTLAAQVEGDLGAKLSDAFVAGTGQGFNKTIVIGSDCPYITETDILDAVSVLDHHDVVLGPATDGGYWLIGMNRPHAGLFKGIPWSTASVLSATVHRAAALGLSCAQLRMLSDIDTIDDWTAYQLSKTRDPAR